MCGINRNDAVASFTSDKLNKQSYNRGTVKFSCSFFARNLKLLRKPFALKPKMPSSYSMESDVITSQPSARSSAIHRDDTHLTDKVPNSQNEIILQNGEIDSKSRFTITPIRNDQPIGPLNLPENGMIPPNDATDVNGPGNTRNTATHSSKVVRNTPIKTLVAPKKVENQKQCAAVTDKFNQPAANKDSHNYSINGPGAHASAETSVGLSVCLLQLCNFCTDCCDEYYKWCCCCCADSELCASCCSGCMECCTACECCCN